MKTQITQTPYYTIAVDPTKNRLYIRIISQWKRVADVATYLADIQWAIRQVHSGFTVLTDLTQMLSPSPEINAAHAQAQMECMKAGCRMTAEVHSEDFMKHWIADKFSKQSKMEKKVFINPAEAEAWLDRLTRELPENQG